MSKPSNFDPKAAISPSLGRSATLQDAVCARYGARALEVLETAASGSAAMSCGSGSCCGTTACFDDPITGNLYTADQAAAVPAAALRASLGCGNPTALVDLHEGEVVLDLGSGGGIDVILSARRVGPSGMAYGVDMTDEMLTLARKNAADAGVENVTFL